MYLKNILEQSASSLISKFFRLQQEEPSKGDWVSQCLKDLKELKVNQTFQEIKVMPKIKFANILKIRMKENAMLYLKEKQKSKGK